MFTSRNLITSLLCPAAMVASLGCHRALQHPALLEPSWEQPPSASSPAGDPDANSTRGGTQVTMSPAEVHPQFLAQHPSVRAAQAEVERARAYVRAAGAWPNPELEGRFVLNGPEAGSVEAALTQTLPISGRTVAARRAARVELEMAEVALGAAEHGATLEASELLASLSHQRRHAALVREIADTSSQLAALVRQRQATAMADPLDVSLVLADAARDQGTLAASRSRLAFIEGQLQTLMGLAPDSYVIQVPELQHDRLHEGATQLLQDAADTSPAWALARLDLERAEWSAREAARSRIPEPSIGPALLGDPEQPSLGLALGIPIPVLAPGQAAYRATLAERDAAHQRLIAAGREASREVHALLAHLTALEHTLDALGGPTLVSARRTADMARDRYRAGQIDILLMLSAQRAWSELETDHLDALLDIRLTQLALERAVGRPLQLQPPLTETP